jgi:hypothetical protein
MMEKIVQPCKVLIGNQFAKVFCKIEVADGELSITGVIGPKSNGNARGGCGQISHEFSQRLPENDDKRYGSPWHVGPDMVLADGWDEVMWLNFLTIWGTYHLNHMKSCCEHQRAFGWDREPIDPARPSSDYDKFDGHSHTWNLKVWAYPPVGHMLRPCPVCGYKCGSAWLKMDLPDWVVDWLLSLPDSPTVPAWV